MSINIYNSEMFRSMLAQLMRQNDSLREALAFSERHARRLGVQRVAADIADALDMDVGDVERAIEALNEGRYEDEMVHRMAEALNKLSRGRHANLHST